MKPTASKVLNYTTGRSTYNLKHGYATKADDTLSFLPTINPEKPVAGWDEWDEIDERKPFPTLKKATSTFFKAYETLQSAQVEFMPLYQLLEDLGDEALGVTSGTVTDVRQLNEYLNTMRRTLVELGDALEKRSDYLAKRLQELYDADED